MELGLGPCEAETVILIRFSPESNSSGKCSEAPEGLITGFGCHASDPFLSKSSGLLILDIDLKFKPFNWYVVTEISYQTTVNVRQLHVLMKPEYQTTKFKTIKVSTYIEILNHYPTKITDKNIRWKYRQITDGSQTDEKNLIISISVTGFRRFRDKKCVSPFRFFSSWLQDDGLDTVVRDSWTQNIIPGQPVQPIEPPGQPTGTSTAFRVELGRKQPKERKMDLDLIDSGRVDEGIPIDSFSVESDIKDWRRKTNIAKAAQVVDLKSKVVAIDSIAESVRMDG
ncbi:hypothetical protein LXL04_029000 [Taraxacum kok-saghyz]